MGQETRRASLGTRARTINAEMAKHNQQAEVLFKRALAVFETLKVQPTAPLPLDVEWLKKDIASWIKE